MQDDVSVCDGFADYLPQVEAFMEKHNIHVFSLYCPDRAILNKALKEGNTFWVFDPYLWLQATVFSKKFNDFMIGRPKDHLKRSGDDLYVRDCIRDAGTKAFVHLPSLVQHEMEGIPSALGHPQSVQRTSSNYNKHWVTNGGKLE